MSKLLHHYLSMNIVGPLVIVKIQIWILFGQGFKSLPPMFFFISSLAEDGVLENLLRRSSI